MESWNPKMVWAGRAPKDNLILPLCHVLNFIKLQPLQQTPDILRTDAPISLMVPVPSIACKRPLQDESHKRESPWLDFPPPLCSSWSLFCSGCLIWVFPCSGGTQSSWMCDPDSLGAAAAPAQPWELSPHSLQLMPLEGDLGTDCECKSLAKFHFILTVPTREGSLTDSIISFLVSKDYNLSIAIHIRMQFGR